MKNLLFLILLSTIRILPQISSLNSSASVFVKVPLSITAVNANLDFGEIILAGSVINATVLPNQGAQFTVQGTPGRSIIITFSNITLSNSQWVSTYGGTSSTLSFIANVVDGSGSTILSGGSKLLSTGGGVGALTLKVGGAISIAANKPHGNYTGQFSFTVSY